MEFLPDKTYMQTPVKPVIKCCFHAHLFIKLLIQFFV